MNQAAEMGGPRGANGGKGGTGTEAGRKAQVVVCVGPGGVGKTTTAAALGLRGARSGLRACVVTIDPARRLADALGIAGLGDEPHLVSPPPGREPWPGELWAAMLDAQTTFDHLVSQYATSTSQAEAILGNRLYRNISAALSGTQEYMAVEKLYELQEDGRFDLVVVDTPPAQHAIDFLEAPKHLLRLLDNRVFRLLMAPTRVGPACAGARRAADDAYYRQGRRRPGGLRHGAVLHPVRRDGGGFPGSGRRANALLLSERTSFVLVCSPRRDAVEEALYLVSLVEAAGANVKTVVVNRCYPRYARLSERTAAALASTPLSPLVENLEQLRPPGGERGRAGCPGSLRPCRQLTLSGYPSSQAKCPTSPPSRRWLVTWEADPLGPLAPCRTAPRPRRLLDSVRHRHDAVETGRTQGPHKARPVAGDHDVATLLPGAAYPADEGTEPGRVNEGHAAHVDHEAGAGRQLGQSLAELADGERVQLAQRAANGVAAGRLLLLDFEHGTSPVDRRALSVNFGQSC